MDILTLIEKKKAGLALDKGEIEWFVRSLKDIADYQISAFLMAVRLKGMNGEETCALAEAMALSGDTMKYPEEIYLRTVDKHSTGGVGDTASLIVMPIAAALGLYMPKMSGRSLGLTGGTIDKLEAIDGFRADLSESEMLDGLRANGGVICGQTASLAPADKILYAIRDTSGTIDSIPLIAASIMSKKLAGGAKSIVLDVKVGGGAFVGSVDEAAELGELMRLIGSNAGRSVSYIVSDMDSPLSRFVGNAPEIYGAVLTLRGERNALRELGARLAARLLRLSGSGLGLDDAYKAIDSGAALRKLRDIVGFSGGDVGLIDESERLLAGVKTIEITADTDGYIGAISAKRTARAVFEMGVGRRKKTDSVNLRAGVEFVKTIGDWARKGETIARIFATEEGHIKAAEEIRAAVAITDKAIKRAPLIYRESD